MTNLASETIDARCSDCVWAIVGFRGVRPDHGGTPDDSKLTGLDAIGPSDQVFDWMADRLAEGPTGRLAWGVDYSASVSTSRWHRVIIP
jgi:hypothetical protein